MIRKKRILLVTAKNGNNENLEVKQTSTIIAVKPYSAYKRSRKLSFRMIQFAFYSFFTIDKRSFSCLN